MINEILTSHHQKDVAENIDQLAKSVGIVPCKWCDASPLNFVAAMNGAMDCESLFCAMCGKYTFQYLKVRQVMAKMPGTWFGGQRDAVLPFLQGIGEWQLCDHEGAHRFAVEAVIRDGLMGGPDDVCVSCRGVRLVSISRYQLEKALSAAVNQAVLARLDERPEFDLKSRHACPHCGAPGSEQVFRNFSGITRDADIYCGRCGEYIRMWNP